MNGLVLDGLADSAVDGWIRFSFEYAPSVICSRRAIRSILE
jgi:hypothetical protein